MRLAVATRDSSEYDALKKATYRLGRTTALCCGSGESQRVLQTGYKALPPIAVYFAWSDLQRNRDLPVGSTSIVVTGSMPMNGVSARFRASMTMLIVARRAAANAGAYR